MLKRKDQHSGNKGLDNFFKKMERIQKEKVAKKPKPDASNNVGNYYTKTLPSAKKYYKNLESRYTFGADMSKKPKTKRKKYTTLVNPPKPTSFKS